MTQAPYSPDAVWKRAFRRRLLAWYAREARDLPWRRTNDPYAIWVSEVMLQQTTVATVKGRFEAFLAAFPTIAALASAQEQSVLRQWEGLGYYRRARQLHRAAQVVRAEHGGEFPRDAQAVRTLPGVGRYTAGAILSLAFDRPEPILEANTLRLYCRLLAFRDDPRRAASQQLLWSFAQEILPANGAGQMNQALMELGATVCLPRQPKCGECPVRSLCPTAAQGLQAEIPLPAAKIAFTPVRHAAAAAVCNGAVLLVRQGDSDRFAGMWDFPRFEMREGLRRTRAELTSRLAEEIGLDVELGERLAVIKHTITRYRITLECFLAAPHDARFASGDAETTWAPIGKLSDYPLNTTARKIAKLLPDVEAVGQRPRRLRDARQETDRGLRR